MEREVDHLGPERSKAEFDVDAMKVVWAGSPAAFDVAHRISRLVAADPVCFGCDCGVCTVAFDDLVVVMVFSSSSLLLLLMLGDFFFQFFFFVLMS